VNTEAIGEGKSHEMNTIFEPITFNFFAIAPSRGQALGSVMGTPPALPCSSKSTPQRNSDEEEDCRDSVKDHWTDCVYNPACPNGYVKDRNEDGPCTLLLHRWVCKWATKDGCGFETKRSGTKPSAPNGEEDDCRDSAKEHWTKCSGNPACPTGYVKDRNEDGPCTWGLQRWVCKSATKDGCGFETKRSGTKPSAPKDEEKAKPSAPKEVEKEDDCRDSVKEHWTHCSGNPACPTGYAKDRNEDGPCTWGLQRWVCKWATKDGCNKPKESMLRGSTG